MISLWNFLYIFFEEWHLKYYNRVLPLEGNLIFSIWYYSRSPSFCWTQDTFPAAIGVSLVKRRCWCDWILHHTLRDFAVEEDSWITNTNPLFLHERPWLSLWIKSIFNKLDIIFTCSRHNCLVTSCAAPTLVTSPTESKYMRRGVDVWKLMGSSCRAKS